MTFDTPSACGGEGHLKMKYYTMINGIKREGKPWK
jgi:hypothetical protein